MLRLSIVLFLVAGFATGCAAAPNLELLAERSEMKAVKTEKEDADWWYVYTVEVRNRGGAGKVRASAKAFSPQGQFYREQVVEIGADERKAIEFVFTEPTFLGDVMNAEKSTRYEFTYEAVR